MRSLSKRGMKTKHYYLVLKDIVSSFITHIPVYYKAGDVYWSVLSEASETRFEIEASVAKQLKKEITQLNKIKAEQGRLYAKDLDYRNPQQWRYSRKLDGLAIEERSAKRRYEQLIYQLTNKEVEICSTPVYGLDKIRERTR